MIADRNSGVTVQGNLVGQQEYRAGIDDENMAHIINLFTDLYSDQERAVIREYSTNARDAQIEAGISAPIQVTLPTPLSPQFSVEDSGVGLNADDIRTIYSRYGTSTKRATNDQNGMLGLGCKSALTYAEQFTVESVKDGTLTICMISRGDDGVPVFSVLSSVPTNRPNGTKVVVPVRRSNRFAEKAAQFYRHWKPGTVLVNGAQPEPLNGLWLTDTICAVKREGYYDDSPNEVVMGNVAYPVEGARLNTGLPRDYRVACYVPIGAVSFTPSREALMYTKNTVDALDALEPQIRAATVAAVQRKVDQANSRREAIQTFLQWRALLGSNTSAAFKYRGQAIPETVPGQFVFVARNSSKLSRHERTNGFLTEYAPNVLFVTGYDAATFTATHKRKLLQYVEDQGLSSVRHFALTAAPALQDKTWIADDQITDWATIKAVVLPKSSPVWRNGRPTGSYDAEVQGCFQHIQADEIDQNEPIFYCRGMNRYQGSEYATLLAAHFPTSTVVFLPENRMAKFKRNFPEALTYKEGIQYAYDRWLATLPQGVRLGVAVQQKSETEWLARLDPKHINDPDLRRAIYIYRNTRKEVSAALKASMQFRIGGDLTAGIDFKCPLRHYPLLEAIRTYSMSRKLDGDLHLYLNAAYAGRVAAGDNA